MGKYYQGTQQELNELKQNLEDLQANSINQGFVIKVNSKRGQLIVVNVRYNTE